MILYKTGKDDLFMSNNNLRQALSLFVEKIRKVKGAEAIYLTGSYANNYAIENSDIDICLFLVVKNHDNSNIDEIITEVEHKYGVSMDISIVDSSDLNIPSDTALVEKMSIRESVLSAKISGKFIWGKDILKYWKLPSEKAYVESTIKLPLEFFSRARGNSKLQYPLQYPDADDYFYGYVNERDGEASTKQIISQYGWIATAMVAVENGDFVTNKKECVEKFKDLDSNKGQYLEEVFKNIREKWNYRLPKDEEEKKQLRGFCEELLTWENNYLEYLAKYLSREQMHSRSYRSNGDQQKDK